MQYRSRAKIFAMTIAVSSGIAAAGSAHADAIDGDWCRGADHFNIEGSTILTPGRNKLEGVYNRYRFAYIAPANEPGAGGEVRMVMIRDEEVVHLQRAGQTGDPEVWRRCKPIS